MYLLARTAEALVFLAFMAMVMFYTELLGAFVS